MSHKIALSAKIESSVGNILEHAVENGFEGIDWSFHPNDFIETDLAERWLGAFRMKYPEIELRYHVPYGDIEIAHKNNEVSERAVILLKKSIEAIKRLDGRYLTVHIGLGPDSSQALCMDRAKSNLSLLVDYAYSAGVVLSLENLKCGYTSDPRVFSNLIMTSGAMVTFDIGHGLSSSANENDWPCVKFIETVASRIVNAHIYEAETHEHVAPVDMSVIGGPIKKLMETPCEWWVVELSRSEDVLRTRRLLQKMLMNGSANPIEESTSQRRSC